MLKLHLYFHSLRAHIQPGREKNRAGTWFLCCILDYSSSGRYVLIMSRFSCRSLQLASSLMPVSQVSLCCFNLKLITEERGEQNTTQARGVELLFHRPTHSSGPLRCSSHTHGPLQAYWDSLLSLFPMRGRTGLKRRTVYFPLILSMQFIAWTMGF